MEETKRAQPATRLALTVEKDLLAGLCLITGSGFTIRVRSGCSIRELLCGQVGIAPDYLDNRIQTIFLNSRPVDDPDRATVTAGATVALSAAMPGLVGAILRKGSYYAALRSRVPGDGRNDDGAANRQGHVVLKLFNMVQQELGPELLRRGILIPGSALGGLLRRSAGTLRWGILAAEIDGTPIAPARLFDMTWSDREVCLIVCTSSGENAHGGSRPK